MPATGGIAGQGSPVRWLHRLVTAVLVTAACVLPAGASLASATPASQTAAFDALFQRLDQGEIFTLDPAQVAQRLGELERLRPHGDIGRDLRYRSLRCSWGFPENTRGALAYAEDGLQRARRAKDAEAQARFHYCRAGYLQSPTQALADLDAGITLSRRIEHVRLHADGLAARGGMHSLLGEQGRALLDLLTAQHMYERAGLKDDAESGLLSIAIAYRRIGDLDKARDYFAQSEAYATRTGDWNWLLGTWLQQGYLHEDEGNADAALEVYGRALALARKQSSRLDIGTVHLGMAYAYILKRQFPRALQSLDHAQAEFTAIGDPSNQEMIDLRRGQAHAGLGQHARALADYTRAAASLERSGNLRYQALLYEARAETHEALGNTEAALADFKRLLAARETIANSSRDQQAQVLRYQFDTSRRDLENQRLQADQTARKQQLSALLAARRWQWTALALGGVLLAVFLTHQLRRLRKLQVLAMTDPLTGVANRRRIERFGQDAFARAAAEQQLLTVLTVDIDSFKPINDTFGHAVGDQVLVRVAKACQGALRQADLLGRMGGEEFLVVLPRTGLEKGVEIAERLRAAIAALALADLAAGLEVTTSVGVAELHADDANLKDLLRRADRALYRAKQNGRDRVEVEIDIEGVAAVDAAARPRR